MSGILPPMPQVAQGAAMQRHPTPDGVSLAGRRTVSKSAYPLATHVFDAGVGLRYIQELLGHSSSKTAEIYTR